MPWMASQFCDLFTKAIHHLYIFVMLISQHLYFVCKLELQNILFSDTFDQDSEVHESFG